MKPVDRRAAMTAIAATAVLGTTAATAATQDDPIFPAIDRLEEAEAAVNAVCEEGKRREKAADDAGLPHEIYVRDHRNAPWGEFVLATSYSEINKFVPRDEYPGLNESYREQLDRRSGERAASYKDFADEELLTKGNEAVEEARKHFAQTTPTTVKGFVAKLNKAAKLAQSDGEAHFDDDKGLIALLASLAASANTLIGTT